MLLSTSLFMIAFVIKLSTFKLPPLLCFFCLSNIFWRRYVSSIYNRSNTRNDRIDRIHRTSISVTALIVPRINKEQHLQASPLPPILFPDFFMIFNRVQLFFNWICCSNWIFYRSASIFSDLCDSQFFCDFLRSFKILRIFW